MSSGQHVAILGQGYAVPDLIRGNDAPIFDWLKAHSPSGSDLFNGLKYRRVLPTADGVIDIMTKACEHVLHQARLKPEHVDMIGRDFPITRGIVAEIGTTLDVICEKAHHLHPDHAKVDARKAVIQQIKLSRTPWSDPAGRDSKAAPVHPAAMMRVIDELVHKGHIFIDAGNCVGWSLNNLVINPPGRYHSALSMGPMGFAVGAVVGGKMAAPDLPCVAVVGDGALMMHGAEISTAAQQRVGAIWIVLDDNDLAMVSQGMAQLLPPAAQWDDYYQLGRPDLALFAQGLGARAVTVTPDQGTQAFRDALQHALEDADKHRRPQVISVRINTQVAPPYGWPTLTPAQCCGSTGTGSSSSKP